MKNVQKVIKVLATIFAIFLAVSIIGGIAFSIFSVFYAFDSNSDEISIEEDYDSGSNNNNNNNSSNHDKNGGSNYMNFETYDFSQSYTNIRDFDIDASIYEIIFQAGTEFHVEMKKVSTKCIATVEDGELSIEDNTFSGHSFTSWLGDLLDGNGFRSLKGGKIIITVPRDFVANSCNIEVGTGTLTLNDFQADELFIGAGTGTVEATNLVARYFDLECGTGSVDFRNVSFLGSDIEAGTGSISISGKMQGQNSIQCGVGSVDLKLEDSQDSYNLSVSKGLGSINVNGSSYPSINSGSANADNSLSIEGGIGNINIDFGSAKQF